MLEVVDHCPRCDQLFRKSVRDICPACVRELEQKYESIYSFIRKRENRESTIEDIEVNTGVEKVDIYRIIRSGRLKTNHFPNLGYPCETQSCNRIITAGRLCPACIGEIKDGLNAIQREKERELRKKNAERNKYKTYQVAENNRW